MCDFSVIARNQRDYQEGEQLVITQLGPHTRGTTSPSDRKTAVCLRSGVCMVIPDLPKDIRKRYELPDGELHPIFMQLPNRQNAHRDALVFENGKTVLVNELPLGLRMVVHTNRQIVGERVRSSAAEPVTVGVPA